MMIDGRTVALAAGLALVLAGCDGSRAVATEDGSAPPTDAAIKKDRRVADGRPVDLARDAKPASLCAIAYRHTEQDVCCCKQRMVVTRAELDADPCLVEALFEMIPQPGPGCPHGCLEVCNCMSPPLPSRVAAWRDGACRFVGECEKDADCVLATDTRWCCSCPKVYPRAVVDGDPCVVPGNLRGSPSPPASCDESCNWLCPNAGPCIGLEPDCDITAMLPPGEKICRGLHN